MQNLEENNNQKLRCPVCQQELEVSHKECPYCGFVEIRKEFNSSLEKKKWEEKVILPLRALWKSSQKMLEEILKKYEMKKEQYKELCDKYKHLANDYNDLKANFDTLKSISPVVAPTDDNPKPGWNTKGIISFKNFNSCGWNNNYTRCEITNIALTTTSNVANVTFLAKKVLDKYGSIGTNGIYFKWRLKNSDGIVVKNGSWARDSLMIGDVTEGCIQISGFNNADKYVLEFLDY